MNCWRRAVTRGGTHSRSNESFRFRTSAPDAGFAAAETALVSATNLQLFSDATALAAAAARDWLAQLEVANRRGARHLVALSGGRIARDFFAATAAAARLQGVSFASAHFFWADERCVPPDDPESNFGMARELLLGPLGIQDEAVHRIRGELDSGDAAAAAADDLCRCAPVDAAGQPVLDLVILGMGEDGHVASLFPGEPPDRFTLPSVYRAVIGPKPPPHRVTLGYPAIAAASQAWVLISGRGKEAALQESLTSSGRTPLARVLQSRSSTWIYTDIRLEGEFFEQNAAAGV